MEDQTVICPFQMCIHQCFWGRLGIYESWYLYPQIVSKWYWGGNNKKKKPNFWKKLDVSTIKYMSTWCSMTYPLCQMLFSSLRLHTADRPMWRLESSSQQFASACIWGTAGSSCAHGMVPPLPARRCLWAAVTLFEGHTEMEHQSENLDFQKQSCGLIYCLLGSAFF